MASLPFLSESCFQISLAIEYSVPSYCSRSLVIHDEGSKMSVVYSKWNLYELSCVLAYTDDISLCIYKQLVRKFQMLMSKCCCTPSILKVKPNCCFKLPQKSFYCPKHHNLQSYDIFKALAKQLITRLANPNSVLKLFAYKQIRLLVTHSLFVVSL